MIFSIFLVLQSISLISSYTLSSTNCPQYCTCDLTTNVLTITCTQPQTTSTFQLPNDFTLNPDLATVTTINAKSSYIQSFPSNICKYTSLNTLDLSNNLLASNLTNTNLNCLKNLVTLRLANNSIKFINSDAFLNLTSLQALDLSYNSITQIPQYLFYKHLTQLRSIDLTRNYLTEMELWPLYLPSIVSVDLRYNNIQKFTNKFGWYFIYDSNLPSISGIATINLQYNSITAFDDNTIQQYGVCSYADYATFVNKYFNVFWLNNNPIICNCFTSQRLVTDSISLIAAGTFTIYTNLYESFCSSTSSYATKRLLNFETNCAALTGTTTIGYPYCVNGTTTTTTITTITTTTSTSLNVSITAQALVSSSLDGGGIAGIVIGCIVAFLILLFIIACICLTEIKACCFLKCSDCYAFFTKCCMKEKEKQLIEDLSSRHYDVFISYNKTNEKSINWIENSFVPYLIGVDAIRKHFLHYGKENIDGQTYSHLIQEKLENSAHIVIVLSDDYLDNEWNNIKLRSHIRRLVNERKAEITCVQMIDVTDEEVEEFVRNEIQETNLRSFELDECCFWYKLRYFLSRHKNKEIEPKYIKIAKDDEPELVSKKREKQLPSIEKKIIEKQPTKLPKLETPVESISIRPNSDVEFPDWYIKGPKIHIHDTTTGDDELYQRARVSSRKQKKIALELEKLGEQNNSEFTTNNNLTETVEIVKHKKKRKSKKSKTRHTDNTSGDGQQSQVSTSNIKPDYSAVAIVSDQYNVADQYNMVKSNRSSYRTPRNNDINGHTRGLSDTDLN